MAGRRKDGKPVEHKGGRPPFVLSEHPRIQHKIVELYRIGCTDTEVESEVKVSYLTLTAPHNADCFYELKKTGQAGGKISLRRLMHQHAVNNPAAAIFLAKQPEKLGGLGMSDRWEIMQDIKVQSPLSQLDISELRRLAGEGNE